MPATIPYTLKADEIEITQSSMKRDDMADAMSRSGAMSCSSFVSFHAVSYCDAM